MKEGWNKDMAATRIAHTAKAAPSADSRISRMGAVPAYADRPGPPRPPIYKTDT